MRKLIDLDNDVIKELNHLAIEQGKDVKNFMQDELIRIARKKKRKGKPKEEWQ